ncbi:pantothenate kinase, type III [[Clostridium] methylpentosum DSM 5476]|uniref:Type III pantothenate kinase n=1 Tax=[Clostridium] methylpentosum DSM 5476 TaxID=537013 RepID=C0EEN1_9FIRM|nr:pantothenate kinase, type III [[Clostridium] methylpentosum DSM 5476]
MWLQMVLTVDIGNTNMEFGIFEGEKLRANFRLVTNRNVTSDEVGLLMTQFFTIQKIDVNAIEAVVIASVVPQVMFSVSNAMRKYIGKEPLVAGENLPIQLKNNYHNPKEVGADRLVNAYAAYRKYGGPLIVVDFGTATTFDLVGEDGSYEGGTIYPGIKVSMEALTRNAAKLPTVELNDPGTAIGRDTVTSMQAGVIYGYVGAVLHMIDKISDELGQKTTVVATGGLSTLLNQSTQMFDVIDKTLTLEGLMQIYLDRQ